MHWVDLGIYILFLIPLAVYIGYLVSPTKNNKNDNKEQDD